ncbi:hypothetical protein CRG98_012066 [Punica granatum]|uniref:Uncharacterized protein n=1 Tax=Punica granatum TaxID=22663 RepID=A0A2I0KG55_PUNGR|nr:hypothetical protein CRG98_012066 [Punica granatum]
MNYLKSVGEVFESRVTRWNPRKDVPVHRVHVRVSWARGWARGRHAGAQAGAQQAHRRAGGRAAARDG